MKECKHLAAVVLLTFAAFTAACASSGGPRPQPFPMPAGSATPPPAKTPDLSPTPAPSPLPAQPVATLIDTALSFRGTPYRNGGSDPRGFDCSGFTQYVFAQHGIALPREVKDQWDMGTAVKAEE